jgi:hypothetical protein
MIELNGSRLAAVGTIARPENRNRGGQSGSGSLKIDQFDPAIRINAVWQYNHLSGTVHKVGRRTGWTYGDILDDCKDLQAPDGLGGTVWIICAKWANLWIDGGDSGAPVFRYGTNEIELLGVVIAYVPVDSNRDGVYDYRYGVWSSMLSYSTDHRFAYGGESPLYDIEWRYTTGSGSGGSSKSGDCDSDTAVIECG